MVRFSVDSCLLVQTTFTYSSKYWTNKQELQPSAGTTRLGKEQKETKLATYHKTPFKYICLAFMVNKNFAKYVLLRMEERQPSLHSVISKNVFCPCFRRQRSLELCRPGCELAKAVQQGGDQRARQSLRRHTRTGTDWHNRKRPVRLPDL